MLRARITAPLIWLTLAVGFCLAYSWVSPQGQSPNERTRLYLSLSLLEGNVAVTEQVERYGKPFDISKRDGEYYTDKAPGSSVIAAPVVAIYQAFGDSDSIEKLNHVVRRWVMVPIALLSFLLVRALGRGSGLRASTANQMAIFFAVGTNFFYYGAAFYGHALVTFLSLLAGWAVMKGMASSERAKRLGWYVLAGFAGGCAFAVEYQAVVVCVALAVGFLSVRAHRRVLPVLAPLVGAAVPLGLTFLYNAAAFGGPLQTGYAHLPHSSSAQIHSEGLYGINMPTLEALHGLILTPSRGLFFCAPLVLLGFLGLAWLWRRCRWLAVYAGVTMVGYLIVIASAEIWYGGWGFGPRLLVPIFGVAAVAAGFVVEAVEDWSPSVRAALTGWLIAAVVYNVLVVTTYPAPPPGIGAPLRLVTLPMLEMGAVSPNLGITALGLSSLWSLLPLALVLVALLAYLIQPLWRRHEAVSSVLASFVVAMAIFGNFAHQHHSETSQARAQKLVESVASRRIHPK
ncbi:MAG: hypothetical protein ACOC9W_00115 [Persicimonas sp.]